MMPVNLTCHGVVKRFGSRAVLDGIDWRVPAGTICGMVGPSGAGKTTLLRIVAGLERATAGTVELAPVAVPQPAAPARVGMVFQDLGLWPHLTARRQVEAVLADAPRRERRSRAEALLAEVCLPPSAWDRRPDGLSGGEGQRLALARAVGPGPDVLLLDEPLAQVDAPLRGALAGIVRDLAERRGMTVVFVSHSWAEAAELCPRVAVLVEGRIRQEGTPAEIYWRPASAEIAHLTGPTAEVPRRLIVGGQVRCPQSTPLERDGSIVVRPQQVHWIAASERNSWRVVACEPRGAGWLATLESADARLALASSAPAEPDARLGIELIPPSG
jgi:ABC-type sulfate/molybdate transport systems ATPase subunit